jgi:hypothetical protein
VPISVPIPTKSPGDLFPSTLWNSYIRDNGNKLLDRGHRILTVAQFTALTGLEDGDEVYLEVDSSNGVIWHLRYVAAEGTYKWRFLGGPPLFSQVLTSEGTGSGSYTALATAGPSIALPRAGDYMVQHGAQISNGTDAQGGMMSYDIGAAAASNNDAIQVRGGGSGQAIASAARENRKTGLTTVTLTAKYLSPGTGTAVFANRFMCVRPVRIRHDA